MSSLKTTNILHPSSASNNIVLDSSGNIAVQAGTAAAPAIQANGDSNTGIYFPAADTIAFTEGGTEACRIDSSGRLLVGTSTARSNVYSGGGAVTPTVQIENNTNTWSNGLSILNYSGSQYGASFALGMSASNTAGTNTLVTAGNLCGRFHYLANDGTNFYPIAEISGWTDGTTGTGDVPGRLVFSTTADGASSPTERMRIRNTGTLCVGTTDAEVSSTNIFTRSTGTRYGFLDQTSAATGYPAGFFNSSGSLVGYISSGASSTLYSTTSDYRLKENVVPIIGAIERLNQLQVYRFNFIADPDTTVDGFIAHEAQAVVPECVSGEKDAINEDGSIKPQGIDQSKLVPLLTAALQEALAEIADLKDRVSTLEGA